MVKAAPIGKCFMTLYLFGGAELSLGQGQPMIDLIKETLINISPRQVLYLPFCRMKVPEGEEDVWGEGWFVRSMADTGIEILEASKEEDIDRADNPVVVVSGGPDKRHALEMINNNRKLKELVINASVYIGESAGAIITAQHACIDRNKLEIIPGLGILKNAIIEPHYSERKYQELLRKEMKVSGAKYGIGIDCVTGMVFDLDKFPDSYEVLGQGSVEVIKH